MFSYNKIVKSKLLNYKFKNSLRILRLIFIPLVLSLSKDTCGEHAPTPDANQYSVEITPQEHQAMQVLLGIIGNPDVELDAIAAIIQKDLGFSGQCNVTIERFTKEPNSLLLKQFMKKRKFRWHFFCLRQQPGNRLFMAII